MGRIGLAEGRIKKRTDTSPGDAGRLREPLEIYEYLPGRGKNSVLVSRRVASVRPSRFDLLVSTVLHLCADVDVREEEYPSTGITARASLTCVMTVSRE